MWCNNFVRAVPRTCTKSERSGIIRACFWNDKSFSTSMYGCLTTKPVNKKSKGAFSKTQNRLRKMLSATEKKRVWHNTDLSSLSAGQFGSGPSVHSERSCKRARQLSAVFSDHITNILGSGEAHPLLPEIGFEVSEVSMAPDLSHIVVKWAGTGSSKDDKVEEVLPEAAAYVRQALTNMHLMGHVPRIKFVKDMTNARIQEVESLLSVADLGPDYEPTALGHDLKDLPKDSAAKASIQGEFEKLARKFGHQEILRSSDFVKSQSKVETQDENDTDGTSLADLGISVKSNIYNVDHTSLMKKIKQAGKHKSRGFKVDSGENGNTERGLGKKTTSKDIHWKDLSSIQAKSESLSAKKILAKEEQELMRHSVSKHNHTDSETKEDSGSDYIIYGSDGKSENTK